MNKLPGIITRIQQSDSIMLVDVDVNGHSFSALLIESPAQDYWLKEGSTISIVFKETEVSLAKGLSGKISMRNRMPCIVKQIERGALLSKIILQFQQYNIVSAITTRSIDLLEISVGDVVEALVKANELSLMNN